MTVADLIVFIFISLSFIAGVLLGEAGSKIDYERARRNESSFSKDGAQ